MNRSVASLSLLFGAAVPLSALAQPGSSEIPDISGVWQWGQCIDGPAFECMLLEEDDELLTERARAYRDAIDEVAQPKYDCAPMPIPHIWTDPYSYEIDQHEDRVIISYGKDDIVRTIWLQGHGHATPAVYEYFYFGHSVGRYADGALIVETSHFTFDPQGLNADFKLPSSTQKKVVERFSRDGQNLLVEVTTRDPFFLREPWSFKTRSAPDPEPLALPWNCDLDGARQILRILPTSYPNDPEVIREVP
jgi:hypothetical protein